MYQFPLHETEIILRKDMASMSIGKTESYNGALYLTTERLVFVGYVMDIRNKYIEEIPFQNIAGLEAAKSLLIIANAITVMRRDGRKLRFVIRERNAWIKDIREQINK